MAKPKPLLPHQAILQRAAETCETRWRRNGSAYVFDKNGCGCALAHITEAANELGFEGPATSGPWYDTRQVFRKTIGSDRYIVWWNDRLPDGSGPHVAALMREAAKL